MFSFLVVLSIISILFIISNLIENKLKIDSA